MNKTECINCEALRINCEARQRLIEALQLEVRKLKEDFIRMRQERDVALADKALALEMSGRPSGDALFP